MRYLYGSSLIALVFLACSPKGEAPLGAQHPSVSISRPEAQAIMAELDELPILASSYQVLKDATDLALGQSMDVPQPGEAGGYAHERHKQNYRDMKNAGYLFTLTGDVRYAEFIKQMLDRYAELYPTLGLHPLAHKQAAGRLFHQILNENVWLLNTAQAYDCIYTWLTPEDRARYEEKIFRPMVNLISVDHAREFDRIHNHGMWSTAAVGMIGLVMGDDELVERALKGTTKDGTGGFLAQVEHLFSPDGYYMEGAYYVRYAMRPLLFFAEALERTRPDVRIYEFKDQIIKKAFYSAVQMTYPNGAFIPINDASRSMNIQAPGILYGTAVILDRYGYDQNLLGLARIQEAVYLNGSGLKLAEAYTRTGSVSEPTWSSVEFRDGDDGEQGGFGILRTKQGRDQTLLAMKYGVHGMGHGHFDQLSFVYYDQGSDVVNDYGFSRWINIETKYGGRYLPENDSYAKQTVAHNTLVVDGESQNGFDRSEADQVHGNRHYFHASDPDIQVMSATANDQYAGVAMQRTMLLIKDSRLPYPVAVDVYRVRSARRHQYDLPLHYDGQIMNTTFDYSVFTQGMATVGKQFGYQHLWQEATATLQEDGSFTWLDGHRYYSYLMDITGRNEIIFGRIGAGDPHFNLRSEPVLIRRVTGKDMVFASVIEPHGFFDEATETSSNAYPELQTIDVMGHSDEATVLELGGKNNIKWVIMLNNGPADTQQQHQVEFNGTTYTWTGNYRVDIN